MATFFVGGVHGVGKSSLSTALAGPLHAEHLIASDLIKYASEPEDPTGKAVANLTENQELLVSELRRHEKPGANIILDGHFCLVTRDGTIARVPLATFRAIRPVALLLVEAPLRQTKEQLEQRERRTYDPHMLLELAREERTCAQHVSSELSVPLKIWQARLGVDEALQFLRNCA